MKDAFYSLVIFLVGLINLCIDNWLVILVLAWVALLVIYLRKYKWSRSKPQSKR
jgi:hypothetical protein